MEIIVNVKEVDGTQMAAKITGEFKLGEKLFPFTAIAFGRIGGQNIGAKLSNETESMLKELGYDLDDVIANLQKNLQVILQQFAYLSLSLCIDGTIVFPYDY